MSVQVFIIWAALPTPVDVRFDKALEHVVTTMAAYRAGQQNLTPLAGDGCRTLRWQVEHGLQAEQALIVRRCLSTSTKLPGEGTIVGAGPIDTPTVEVDYNAAQGTLYLELKATENEPGFEVQYVTHVYREDIGSNGGNSGSSIPYEKLSLQLHGAFDFAQLEPVFAEELANTSCPLVPNSGYRCANSGNLLQRLTRWGLDCGRNNTAAVQDSFSKMQNAVMRAVDLRVAKQQGFDGFAAGIETALLDSRSADPAVQALFPLYDSMRGSNNVVAQVTTSRINLLAAVVVGILGVILWQAAQFADASSAELALKYRSLLRRRLSTQDSAEPLTDEELKNRVESHVVSAAAKPASEPSFMYASAAYGYVEQPGNSAVAKV